MIILCCRTVRFVFLHYTNLYRNKGEMAQTTHKSMPNEFVWVMMVQIN